MEQDKLLRSKLLTLKFAEKQFFSQKIKCNFLKDSDKGSKFFHALMDHNHRRNFIPAIMTTHGRLSSSLEEVGAIFVNYLQQLLGTSKSTIPLASAVIHSGPCLSSSSYDLLLSPVSHKDIRKAVFSIGDDKAPRPYGYSSLFFKKTWHIYWGKSLCGCTGFLCFWKAPISCCNVIYKVITKILAGRLAHALTDIISPMQNAFLGGRLMSDNINLVQELLKKYGRKRSSPRNLLKVDFRKAFDSV